LAALAFSAGPSAATVAALPAGRGEVFTQLFQVSATGAVTALDDAAHLPPVAMIEKYGDRTALKWAGAEVESTAQIIRAAAATRGRQIAQRDDTEGWALADSECTLAEAVALLALQRFEKGESNSAEMLAALYVRPADAKPSAP